jgi:hypothetical protein
VVSCSSPLPVELLYFRGRRVEGTAVLTWATSSETDNDYFEVERSSDGVHFERAGYVLGKGNSSDVSSYRWIDEQIPATRLYYRLVQVDKDGSRHYSNIVVIDFSREESVLLYPNPFTGAVTVKVVSATSDKVQLKISTGKGQEIYNGEHAVNEEVRLGQEYAEGIYYLKVITGDEVYIYKIVKE